MNFDEAPKKEEIKEKLEKKEPEIKPEVNDSVSLDKLEKGKETKENLGKEALNFFKKITDDKPIAILDDVAELMKDHNWQGINDLIENCPSITKFREKILEKLAKDGYLEYKPEGIVVDLEKIKNLNYNLFRSSLPGWIRGQHSNKVNTEAMTKLNKTAEYFGKGRKSSAFFYTFYDQPVISKEDYEQNKMETKDLFYIPESKEKAYDIEEIKKSKFYLYPWELYKDRKESDSTKELFTKNQEKVGLTAYLALQIYHPFLGGGERNDQGQLLVHNEQGEKEKLTTEFFRYQSSISFSGKNNEKFWINNPSKFFENFQNDPIVEKKLLCREDFDAFKSKKDDFHSPQKINRKCTMIRGEDGKAIRYYVGLEKEVKKDPTMRALNLNNKIGGIIGTDEEGNEKLLYRFNLTNNENPELFSSTTQRKRNGYTYNSLFKVAGKKISQPEKIDYQNIEKDREEILKFIKLFNINNQIKKLCNINILEKYTSDEDWQKMTTAIIKENKTPEEIAEFINKFGFNNLDQFLTSNLSIDDFNKYISMGGNLENIMARELLIKYNEILKKADDLQQEINKITTKNVSEEKIKLNTINRAKKILIDFADQSAKVKISGDSEQYINLLHSLDEINSDIVLFSSIFKESYKDNSSLELSEIENTEITMRNPIELSPEDKIEMERIYATNKQHWPKELLAEALNEFKRDIKENKGRFYILKVQNKIISFSWFNDISEDRTYCGYFNVRPEARESNIGQALKKVAYQNEGQSKALECYVFEQDKALIDNYATNYGFEVEQENCDPTGTGKSFYKLVRKAKFKQVA